jgi:hypothetical protein
MRCRFALVPLLWGALLTLVAFAHASPPDETWRSGVYDEADFDDVIDLIVSLSGAVPDSAPRIFQRAPLAAAVLISLEPCDLPPRLLRPDDTRSPPVPLRSA